MKIIILVYNTSRAIIFLVECYEVFGGCSVRWENNERGVDGRTVHGQGGGHLGTSQAYYKNTHHEYNRLTG